MNIFPASFGGNPEHVTIFGQSAGGASVAYHLINQKSRPYFKRAILQSGSGQNPWAYHDQNFAKDLALEMGRNVNCISNKYNNLLYIIRKNDLLVVYSISKVVNCLKSKPAEILVENLPRKLGFLEFGWTPVIDGELLTENPSISMENGEFMGTDLLIGKHIH